MLHYTCKYQSFIQCVYSKTKSKCVRCYVPCFLQIAKITITFVVRGREEENVEETQVTCGKTAGKVATSAAEVAVSSFRSFYLIDKTQ